MLQIRPFQPFLQIIHNSYRIHKRKYLIFSVLMLDNKENVTFPLVVEIKPHDGLEWNFYDLACSFSLFF